jgi:tetratricopeptide (TPR) repeat protein
MIRLSIGVLVFAIVASASAAQDFDPRAVERRGLELFGDGRWLEARAEFARLEAWLGTKPVGAKNYDNAYRGFSWTALCDEARALSAAPPAPLVHRLLVLVPLRSRFSWRGGEFDGEFAAADLATVERTVKAAARVIWTLSGGRWRWEFDIRALDCSLAALASDPSGDDWRFLQASLRDLSPYPSRLLADAVGGFDTLVMYWNSARVADAQGSVPTGSASVKGLDLVPDYLAGPPRGLISISQQLMDRPGTLVHEWFHVAESALGIRPAHGYQAKNQDEFSYYRDALRRAAEDLSAGSDPLAFSRLSPARPELFDVAAAEAARADGRPTNAELEALNAAAYQARDFEALRVVSLKLTGRYPAIDYAWYWQGVALNNLGRKAEAIAAFSAGLAVAPDSARSLVYRGDLYLQLGRNAEAVADFGLALSRGRTQEGFIRDRLKSRADKGEAWAREALAELGL